MMREVKNYIDGEWTEGKSETIERYNPADQKELVATVAGSSVHDVNEAVFAAVKAKKKWAQTAAPERGAYLQKSLIYLSNMRMNWRNWLRKKWGSVLLKRKEKYIVAQLFYVIMREKGCEK